VTKEKAPAREWDGDGVRALRRHLGLSQDDLAEELGVRQQTVSEWETGRYRPRGASATVLNMVAERAEFEYVPQSESRPADKPQRSRDRGSGRK
jgi:DNA-binding transcriptional regulator YiaG